MRWLSSILPKQDDNLSTSVWRHFAPRLPLSFIWSDCRSSYLVFLCIWSCNNLIRQTHYVKKICFKVKCVYFSPGNALGPLIGLHQMKILWWEQDICSLSAHSPLAADWSALAHLLFFLYRLLCTSVLCLCVLHAYLCVIGLSEMEKADWGLSWAEGREGVVCIVKTRAVASLCVRLLSTTVRPSGRRRGKVGRSLRADGAHPKTSSPSVEWVELRVCPSLTLAPSGVSQQRWVRQLEGVSLCATSPPQGRRCLFRGQGRDGREGGDTADSAGSVCLCMGLFCRSGLGLGWHSQKYTI